MAQAAAQEDDSFQPQGDDDDIDIPAENEEPEPEKPRIKKAKRITSKKATPDTVQEQKAKPPEADNNMQELSIDLNSSQSSISAFAPKASPQKTGGKSPSKARVDKNYQRVMDLEREVLELYKMLDYWKGEAKSMQETNAESNQKLRIQLNAQKLISVARH